MRILLVLVAAAAVACNADVTSPTQSIQISPCGLYWVAYKNEGGAWTRLEQAGPQTLVVTHRLAIAWAHGASGLGTLNVAYVGAGEVGSFLDCFNGPITGQRTLSGTVRGVPANHRVELSFGRATVLLPADATSFSFYYAPVGSNDLIAMRWLPPGSPVHIDKLIIRRAQGVETGVVPLLDFAASEAFAPASRTVNWTGPGAFGDLFFLTASGNEAYLSAPRSGYPETNDVPRSAAFLSIPSDRLVAGDIHRLTLISETRRLVHYYRAANDLNLTFGPDAGVPTFTPIATAPHVRHRVDVPGQALYGELIWVNRAQTVPRTPVRGSKIINLYGTRRYFGGTPATWSLEVPDFAGLTGVGTEIGFDTGSFVWSVIVSSRPRGFDDRQATHGLTHRTATRDGTSPQ